MRAAARHLPAVQHINFIGVLNGREAVRNDDERLIPYDFGDGALHLLFVFGVGKRRCFVQDDDGRIL